MACSNKNILKNGNFQAGLSSWEGTHVRLVKNPVSPKDSSILMGDQAVLQKPVLLSVLKQKVRGSFESRCAYYLYFKLGKAVVLSKNTILLIAVTYLDAKGRILRTTPMVLLPKSSMKFRWFDYFSIVPPIPANTHSITVAFILQRGILYVDSIRLASHDIALPGQLKTGVRYENEGGILILGKH